MSVHHTPDEVARDDSGMNLNKIVVIGLVSLFLFAVSAVVAYVILVVDTKSLQAQWGVSEEAKLIGKDEIGLVDHVPFDTDRRLEHWLAAKRQRLQSYGWVDRSKGLIHMPIEKAIDQVIAEGGKPQAPAPSAPAAPNRPETTTETTPGTGSGR